MKWLRVCLFGLSSLMAAWAMAAPPYPLGVTAPPPALAEWARAQVKQVVPSERTGRDTLPSRVVNIDYLPRVASQEGPSCAAWASTYYYKTWQEAKEHGWRRPDPAVDPEHVLSPAFTYGLYSFAEQGVAAERELREATPLPLEAMPVWLMFLTLYGAPTVADMSLYPSQGLFPSTEAIYAAFPYRAKDLYALDYTTDAGFEALKAHLASGDLAVTVVTVTDDFVAYPAGPAEEVYWQAGGDLYDDWCDQPPCSPLHALTIIGYDDDKPWYDDQGVEHRGAVLLVNSWGSDWGVELSEAGEGGFVWMSYDFFRTQTSGTAYYLTDRIGYVPKLVGSVGIDHPRVGELQLELMAGDPDAPRWSMDLLPPVFGAAGLDQLIPFDATDYYQGDELAFWLRVVDLNLPNLWTPPATGTLFQFDLQREDGARWEATGVPLETVDFNSADPQGTVRWLTLSALPAETEKLPADAAGTSASHLWADFDGNGRPDLLFFQFELDAPPRCRLFANEGEGALVEHACAMAFDQFVDAAAADYDGDGRVDVVVSGFSGGHWVTRLYRNLGNFQLVPQSSDLPGSQGFLQWLDYDGDGRLDLALLAGDGTPQVWRQDETGRFADLNLGLPTAVGFAWNDFDADGDQDLLLAKPAVVGENDNEYWLLRRQADGSLVRSQVLSQAMGNTFAWGDWDGDGLPDLAFTTRGGTQGDGIEFWRNQGDGTLVLAHRLDGPAPLNGGMSWADLDNDGRLDLLLWGAVDGFNGLAGARPRVLRNQGNGAFADWGLDLAPTVQYTLLGLRLMQAVDYDGDGDLDLSVGGSGTALEGTPPPRHFVLYRSLVADREGLARANEAPTPPTPLAVRELDDGRLALQWSAGSDDTTPAAALGYRLKVGRNPGGTDLVNPLPVGAEAISARLEQVLTSSEHTPFYWSLQAVDAGLRPSAWSAPRLYRPAGAPIPGDLNGDGQIDVADLVATARMAEGLVPADSTLADRNGDGRVTVQDTQILEQVLLGEPLESRDLVARALIGPAGGTLGDVVGEGAALVVPPGAFETSVLLSLERIDDDRPFEGLMDSPLFRIQGLPAKRNLPLELRIRDDAGDGGSRVIAHGETTFAYERPVLDRNFQQVTADAEVGGYYRIELPASDPQAAAAAVVLRETAGELPAIVEDEWVWVDDFVLLSRDDDCVLSTHFTFCPVGVQVTDAQFAELARIFEYAYRAFTDPPYGFQFDFGSRGRLLVQIKKLGSTTFALAQTSKLGDTWGYIDVNYDKLSQNDEMEATALHELFHYLQELYDDQPLLSRLALGSDYLWLEEAASVWSESLAEHPKPTSVVFEENVWDALAQGLESGQTGSHLHRQLMGYGQAGLIQYLVTQLSNGPARLNRLIQNLQTGRSAVDLLLAELPQPYSVTWPDYVERLVTGRLFSLSYRLITQLLFTERHYLTQADQYLVSGRFTRDYPPLSAVRFLFRAKADQVPALPDDLHLAVRARVLDGGSLGVNDLFLMRVKHNSDVTALVQGEVVARGQMTCVDPPIWKLELPDLKARLAEGWEFMPVVVNSSTGQPVKVELTLATTSAQPYSLRSRELDGWPADQGVPGLSVGGHLEGGGWSDPVESSIDIQAGGEVEVPKLDLQVPGLTPRTLILDYPAQITRTTTRVDDGGGYYTQWQVERLDRYRLQLSKYQGTSGEPQPYQALESGTGHFQFELPDDARLVTGVLEVDYRVTRRQYDPSGQPVGDAYEYEQSRPLLLLYLEL